MTATLRPSSCFAHTLGRSALVSTRRLSFVLCMAAALLAAAPAAAQRAVAFFNGGAYVDVVNEGAALRAEVVALGHVVTDFTGTADANWATALGSATVLVIPELESGDLGAALSATTQALVKDFVEAGGNLVIAGSGAFGVRNDLSFLNPIFGYSIAGAGIVAAGASDLGADAAGTAFAGGPDPLAHPSAVTFVDGPSLPSDALAIYERTGTPTSIPVFTVPVGFGHLTYVGYDWFTGANADWATVLDSAITIPSPVREVAYFNDPAFVDTSRESVNMRADLVSFGHNVTDFVGTSDAVWAAALGAAQVIVIPELELATLAPALSATTLALINDFVTGGGNLVISGDPNSLAPVFLNSTFGFSVTYSGDFFFDTSTLNAAAAAGTTFAAGPSPLTNSNGAYALDVASLPTDSVAIYTTNSAPTAATVMTVPVGFGNATYLSYDWWFAQDADWAKILNAAVLARPATREVAFFNDGALGAELLNAFKGFIEDPVKMLV